MGKIDSPMHAGIRLGVLAFAWTLATGCGEQPYAIDVNASDVGSDIGTVNTPDGPIGSGVPGTPGDPGLGGTGEIPGGGGGTTLTIRHIQPALAVRGTGCLNCHANIRANVVTDFGAGNTWYMEQEKANFADGSKIFTNGYYSPYTWQTMLQVAGQVIVPAAPVPTLMGGTPIAAAMVDPTMPDFAKSWMSYFSLGTPPAAMAMTQNVAPGMVNGVPLPPVIAPQTVYIGAPTVAQIKAIAPTPTALAPWAQVIATETGAGLSIPGLSVVAGTTGGYLTNTGPMQCSGMDVVINGTLLLNNAQIYAEMGGCRLYVTGSVFIEGPITYLNSGATADPTDNLQITSATSVIMGVGLSGKSYVSGTFGKLDSPEKGINPLHTRLMDDSRQPLFRSAMTGGAYSAWSTAVYAEATNIGPTLIQDASVIAGAASTAVSDAGQTRVSIDYQHLLLNAPVVHSRYLGTTSGVIVSEIAEMSLGQFYFTYDPVFMNTQVSILPALPGDILCVVTTGGTPCNPVAP